MLRDVLGLTGTKYGCGRALCGACTVVVDGQRESGSVYDVKEASGRAVTTIEVLRVDGATRSDAHETIA